ncbi:FadR/GntR family transcriptional regulator [Sphingomonas sp. R86521]|uniref:FadR/GntR family transcriptional regulator n=1 Tax=Sphingomonas sp. R86521 TaxID=3093860 RepID=UPI0036D3AAF5
MSVTKAATLADDLVRLFEAQIEAGILTPGDRYPTERQITEEFLVSRTVVREAFARLAARGLLESRRGAGAFVGNAAHYRAFQVTPEEVEAIEDVLKLLEMRMGFESEMAELAAERRSEAHLAEMRDALAAMDRSEDANGSVLADAAFHAAIARATGNDYFERFTTFLGVRLIPSWKLYLQADDPETHRGYARTINRDHEAIYSAIEDGDGSRARRAAREHMERSLERYRGLSKRS